MKAVLISIQPKWCELIASGKKTVEVRKTRPKIDTPFKCYIYCTQNTTYNPVIPMRYEKEGGNIYTGGKHYAEFLTGKVIGEFVCDKIYDIHYCHEAETGYDWWDCHYDAEKDCLSNDEFDAYLMKKGYGYGWHISDLVIYDTPRELSEFSTPCKMRERLCGICDYAVHGMDGDLIDCNTSITRPPQSWCYCEELKGE